MRKIEQLLQEYGKSHQNPTNKMIHWICVPLIFFSVIGLLFSIPPGPMENLSFLLGNFANWATIVIAIVLFYYISLSLTLALGMFFFCSICLALSNLITIISAVPLWVISLFIFGTAWFFQFLGHKLEGKSPSFLQDLQFLLIGPAWLMQFIYRRLGLSY